MPWENPSRRGLAKYDLDQLLSSQPIKERKLTFPGKAIQQFLVREGYRGIVPMSSIFFTFSFRFTTVVS